MKKGFTLVELLAVIVILTVIALIVTPMISKVIRSSKQATAIESAKNYITAANNAAAVVINENSINITSNSHIFETSKNDNVLSKIKVGGTTPTYVYLNYDVETKRINEGMLCLNGMSIYYSGGNAKISDTDYCNTELVIPGLYDSNDRLVASWDLLVNKYGMNINWYEDEGPIHRSGYDLYEKDGVWYYLDENENEVYANHNAILYYLHSGDGEFEAYELTEAGWYYLTEEWQYIKVDINDIESGAPVIVLQKLGIPLNTCKLILPSTITTIPINAFMDVAVDTVTIPESVSEIGKWAFADIIAEDYDHIKTFEFASTNSWTCTETSHRYDNNYNPLPLESYVKTPEELNATESFGFNTLQMYSLSGIVCVKNN